MKGCLVRRLFSLVLAEFLYLFFYVIRMNKPEVLSLWSSPNRGETVG